MNLYETSKMLPVTILEKFFPMLKAVFYKQVEDGVSWGIATIFSMGYVAGIQAERKYRHTGIKEWGYDYDGE